MEFVAVADDDGYLYLADRKSDMVISGGVNIYPREIEDSLHQHPDVVDCAVLGVPDDRWGEILYAVVQPRADVVGGVGPALPFVAGQHGSTSGDTGQTGQSEQLQHVSAAHSRIT